ncbi:MAG: hypothetical protein ACYDHD_09335 [Vulcanimicrobiaceae bacterium]
MDARISDPRGSGTILAIALAYFAIACGLVLGTGASLAALHAFAAFIVLAFVAASNQLIPVLTGAPTGSARLVIMAAVPLTIGFAFLIASFLGVPLFAFAGELLLLGAIVWTAWISVRLLHATSEPTIGALIGFAAIAFLAAATIGAAMTLALAGQITITALQLAPLHALLALAAFTSTAIIAVSVRLVPMFALAHAGVDRLQAVMPWAFAGAATVAVIWVAHPLVLRLALALMLVALSVLGSGHVHELRVRIRKHLDVSLRYAGIAWIYAMVAVCTAIGATWWAPAAKAAVALAVLGWASITIVGYAYKILGFLAWQYGRELWPGAKFRALGAAIPETSAMVGLLFLGVGTLSTAMALIFEPAYVRLAFIPYACGAITVLLSYVRLIRPYMGIGGTS